MLAHRLFDSADLNVVTAGPTSLARFDPVAALWYIKVGAADDVLEDAIVFFDCSAEPILSPSQVTKMRPIPSFSRAICADRDITFIYVSPYDAVN